MKMTRACPAGRSCAPVQGWEEFLAHIYEQHTLGSEEERWAMVQRILQREPGTPGERKPHDH